MQNGEYAKTAVIYLVVVFFSQQLDWSCFRNPTPAKCVSQVTSIIVVRFFLADIGRYLAIQLRQVGFLALVTCNCIHRPYSLLFDIAAKS